MSSPNYFSFLPNINYALSANKAGQINYAEFKDFFRKVVVKDDIFKEDTLYTKYTIKNGERPDQISYEMYGDEQYYWIILQINDIIDYYSQWPLSQKELDEYVVKKYGTNGGTEIHHYETVETLDEDGNLMLPGGLQVPSDFKYEYPSSLGSSAILTSLPLYVTNSEYERRINEKKSDIYIMQQRYIYDYVREFKNYSKNVGKQVSFISIDDITP